jgi:hypothetical protein
MYDSQYVTKYPTKGPTRMPQSVVSAVLIVGNLPPWRQTWANDPNCGQPANIVSGKTYRGINLQVGRRVFGVKDCPVLRSR